MAAAAVSKQNFALASTDTAMDVDAPLEQQQDNQEDLYTRLKTLQRQLEFFEIQVRCRSQAQWQRSCSSRILFFFDVTGTVQCCIGQQAAACCWSCCRAAVPDASQLNFCCFQQQSCHSQDHIEIVHEHCTAPPAC